MALRLYFKSYRFKHRGVGLEDFEPDEVVPYDYILLDSRTGITEVGGLCIGPLADRLVVLSALNEQNIEGTLMVLKEAGIEPHRRSERLLAEAVGKYTAALAIEPEDHETLSNLGAALLEQAKRKKEEEKGSVFESARDRLISAEKHKPGSASFNLACLAALLGDEAESIRWLKSEMEHNGGVSRKQIAADSDFDPIRELPDFKKYLATLPEE